MPVGIQDGIEIKFIYRGGGHNMDTIKLAGIVPESYTDGIGIRYTIFTQGCKHYCPDCHNPETWDFDSGNIYKISDIIKDIKENPLLDGVTLSGGDPMYRVEETLNLIKAIRENTDLNIWLYTGFSWEECLADEGKKEILENIDVLVDGEYQKACRALHLRFRGSSNQRIIDVQKSLQSNKVVILIDD